MEEYKPNYTLTEEAVNLVINISDKITHTPANIDHRGNVRLHRALRIQSVYSTLKIENNSLSIDQVTDVIAGKTVVGPRNDIQEVKNADIAYRKIRDFNPMDVNDLLTAHGLLTKDVIDESGPFRKGDVGIQANGVVIHVAPPADLVQYLIYQLFDWYKKSNLHPLIKSCIFHYEFEFIHPFADGNGRCGRLWHTALLGLWNELFYMIPVEEIILEHQQDYYNAFIKSTNQADCSPFIEFMLRIILEAVSKTVDNNENLEMNSQITSLLAVMNGSEYSARELMERLGLSHMPSFRKDYLNPAITAGFIEMTIPGKPKSPKQKYKKIRQGKELVTD